MEISPEELEYINQIQEQLETSERDKRTLAKSQMSMFTGETDENLIRYQLDLKEDLDKIYHLLRGDRVQEDAEGNVIYLPALHEEEKPFNEFGVQLIMNIISFYLNRNTILSNYDEKTINEKMFDFGIEIMDLIHNRYEEMGMDTPGKRKMYLIITRELIDTVHSAYLRALNGGERESLRTARNVSQHEAVGYGRNFPIVRQQRRSLNPFNWGRR